MIVKTVFLGFDKYIGIKLKMATSNGVKQEAATIKSEDGQMAEKIMKQVEVRTGYLLERLWSIWQLCSLVKPRMSVFRRRHIELINYN